MKPLAAAPRLRAGDPVGIAVDPAACVPRAEGVE